MRYILDREMQKNFLLVAIESKDMGSEYNEMVEGCKYFDFEIHANSYFISKDIQQKLGKVAFAPNYISSIYDFSRDANFILEEVNDDFIDYMLQNPSGDNYNIDLDIFNVHEKYVNRYD